jgi:hypothetical protein
VRALSSDASTARWTRWRFLRGWAAVPGSPALSGPGGGGALITSDPVTSATFRANICLRAAASFLDSDPAREVRECLDKLQPLLTAVGAALGEPACPPGPRPAGISRPTAEGDHAVTAHRPEAGLGVFETMLVTGGTSRAWPRT